MKALVLTIIIVVLILVGCTDGSTQPNGDLQQELKVRREWDACYDQAFTDLYREVLAPEDFVILSKDRKKLGDWISYRAEVYCHQQMWQQEEAR